MPKRPCLFLSHAGVDTEDARELKRRILGTAAAASAGLEVWFDKDDLEPGRSWQAQIAEAISGRATAFAVYCGTRGLVNWVDAEVEVALARAMSTPGFRFVPVLGAGVEAEELPPFARRFQGVTDPLGNPAELSRLVAAVLGEEAVSAASWIDQPFVGLRPMREADAGLFFGRNDEVAEVIGALRRRPIVAIVAESGAGKSSLAMAGVASAFRGGAIAGDHDADGRGAVRHVVVMRPSSSPLEGLRAAVTSAAERMGLAPDARAALRRRIDLSDPSEAAFAIRCDLPAGTTLTLLIVDQFEELLTQSTEAEREPFLELLLWLADHRATHGVSVLLTWRSDYLNLISVHPRFADRLHADGDAAVVRLRRISDAGLDAAIREPLKLAGHRDAAEQAALVRLVARDILDSPGNLALAQMALYATWRGRAAGDGGLVNAYAAIGGLSGALARQADRVRLELLGDEERARLLPLFARLVRTGDTSGATRRMARLDELDPARQALARRLASDECARILIVGDENVEVAHEALITQWPWLQGVLNERAVASALRTLGDLIDRAAAYRAAADGSRGAYVATGAELAAFDELARQHGEWLSASETGFVRRSVHDARRAQRLRRALLYGSLALTASLAVATGVAVDASRRASALAAKAERSQRDVERLARAQRQTLDTRVAVAPADLDARREAMRSGETSFGRLAADGFRRAAGADFAFIPSGSMRSDRVIRHGETLTYGDIIPIFPFSNAIVRVRTDGRAIRAALELGFSRLEGDRRSFLHISGAAVTIDPRKPAGQRVVSVSINGRPLVPERVYTVAMQDFNLQGGDGFGMFQSARPSAVHIGTDILLIGIALAAAQIEDIDRPRVIRLDR